MFGIFCGAIFDSVLSVYIFHDSISNLNEAFAGLYRESVLFSLSVGGAVGLLTLLGRYFFHLGGYSPRAKQALFLGIGVALFQYPWDFAGRKLLPKFADSSLSIYLILAIVLCTVVLLRDNFKQKKLCEALNISSSV
jgi:hypothetical protein